jgi:hypothetical protein
MYAEVSLTTIRDWLRGETKTTAQFKKDVEKARADLQLLAVGNLRRVIGEDKGAAMYVAQSVAASVELDRLRELTTA